jgi:outer membrane protein TolC
MPAFAASQGVKEYTLKEVRDLAAARAPQIEQKKADIDTARANESDAYSAMKSAEANSLGAVYQMTGGTYDSELITPGMAQTLETVMQGVQSAIDAYEDYQDSLSDEKKALDQLVDRVGYEAEALYLQLVYLEDSIELSQKSLELLQKKEQITRKQYELGMVTQLTVDQAVQDVRNLEQTIATLKDTLATARLQMNSYLGLPAGTAFLLAPVEFLPTPYEKEAERIEQLALEHSLTIEQLSRNLDKVNRRADQITGSGNSTKERLAATGRTLNVALTEAKRSLKTLTEAVLTGVEQNKNNVELLKKKLLIAETNLGALEQQYALGLASQMQILSERLNVETIQYDIQKAEFDYYQSRRKVQLLQKGIIITETANTMG